MTKRLRIFCGPNGSGKSTLHAEWEKNKFRPILFVNSDEIEKEITEKDFFDVSAFNLHLGEKELTDFLNLPDSISLIKKAAKEGFDIHIKISDNVIRDNSKNKSSYGAALISSFIRWNLLYKDISFSFESVMSHPSKLSELHLAKKLGYRNYVYFICTDNPEVNVSRVENRANQGGHSVPQNKIRSRYDDTLSNLYPALLVADKAFLFDNSDQMKMIAQMENQEITLTVDQNEIPNWFFKYIVNRSPS